MRTSPRDIFCGWEQAVGMIFHILDEHGPSLFAGRIRGLLNHLYGLSWQVLRRLSGSSVVTKDSQTQ